MGSESVPEFKTAVLEVVGTDASGLEGLSLPWRCRLPEVDLVAAPQRLLDSLRPWLHGTGGDDEGQGLDALSPLVIPGATPELIPTDRPEQLLARLRPALAEGKRVILLASGDIVLRLNLYLSVRGKRVPDSSQFSNKILIIGYLAVTFL